MRKLLLACAVALSLGGCAQLQNAWSVITSASVSPDSVVVAVNAFNAVEASATNYLLLVKCTGSNGPICRDPKVTPKLIQAVRSGRIARANLEQFLQSHPGQLGPTGLYDALQAAITTIQQIVPPGV